jgi:hypothetical protein
MVRKVLKSKSRKLARSDSHVAKNREHTGKSDMLLLKLLQQQH